MTYSEAIQFLYGLQQFGANFGLENTRKLAALVGNPQTKLRFIHVAGTNGKGSTCAMLESIYRAAGLRVGLFTSPHLVSFRERIQINRQLIPETDLIRLVAEVAAGILPGGQNVADTKHAGGLPTAFGVDAVPGGKMPPATAGRMPAATLFEVVTVLALKFFAEQKCDLVIWETGLGGRLDATNIVTPLASVITNIAFDHQQWLGETLEKIAAEKAGIIKRGVPVLTATENPEALAVIKKIAQEKMAPLTILTAAGRPPLVQFAALDPDAAPLPLLGEHQKLNAALALATVAVLQKQIPVAKEKIGEGLANLHWLGRLQLIEKPNGQKFLLDGAHNVAGVEALGWALTKIGAPAKGAFIIGLLGDKDWRTMCEMLAPRAAKFFTVPVANARTADAQELAETIRSANPAAAVVVCQSFSAALIASKNEPYIVVTGSLYLVGEALESLGFSPANPGERGLNDWTATPARQ